MKSKTPEDHLNEAANNMGFIDFKTMLLLEESSVIEPVLLGRMDEYAKQQASAVIKELEEVNGVIGTLHLNHAINLIKKQFNIV